MSPLSTPTFISSCSVHINTSAGISFILISPHFLSFDISFCFTICSQPGVLFHTNLYYDICIMNTALPSVNFYRVHISSKLVVPHIAPSFRFSALIVLCSALVLVLVLYIIHCICKTIIILNIKRTVEHNIYCVFSGWHTRYLASSGRCSG